MTGIHRADATRNRESDIEVMNMELIRAYIRNLIIYSVLASCCMQMMPAKKYEQLSEITIGLGYICMFLDYGKRFLGV